VLAQFPGFEFSLITLPFIDSVEKARDAAARIGLTPGALVFSSLTDPGLRTILRNADASLFDVFDLVAPPSSLRWDRPPPPAAAAPTAWPATTNRASTR